MSKIFELKEEHILILQKVGWIWDDVEYGGIAMDSKRPFGFSGGIEGDIAEAIHYIPKNKGEGLNFEEKDKMRELYHETYDALMFILNNRTFEVGTYEYDFEDEKWKIIN